MSEFERGFNPEVDAAKSQLPFFYSESDGIFCVDYDAVDKELHELVAAGVRLRSDVENFTKDRMVDIVSLLQTPDAQIVFASLQKGDMWVSEWNDYLDEKEMLSEQECSEFLADVCGSAFINLFKVKFPEYKLNNIHGDENIYGLEDALFIKHGGAYLVDNPEKYAEMKK